MGSPVGGNGDQDQELDEDLRQFLSMILGGCFTDLLLMILGGLLGRKGLVVAELLFLILILRGL